VLPQAPDCPVAIITQLLLEAVERRCNDVTVVNRRTECVDRIGPEAMDPIDVFSG
jgi:hypothetical protein